MNFVRTKIKLDEMQAADILTVSLDDGEAIESVSKSVTEEGHAILNQEQKSDKTWILTIEKN